MAIVSKPQFVYDHNSQSASPVIQAVINTKMYSAKDISSGGISIQGIEGDFTVGEKMPITVKFLSKELSLDISVLSEVQHYNKQKRILGCRFIQLTPDHIALLNQILKSMAAQNVSKGNIFGIVSNQNMIGNTEPANTPIILRSKKQMAGLAVATLLGLAAFVFIAVNIYEALFVMKAQQATVEGPVIEIRAFSDGVFTSSLEPDATTIEPGQNLAELNLRVNQSLLPRENDGLSSSHLFTSPCDCFIVENYKDNGDYVRAGENLVSLIPVDAKLWVTAELEPEKAAKIRPDTTATIVVAGSPVEYTGRISSLKTVSIPSALAFNAPYTQLTRVKVIPNQKIPAEYVGRPAHVIFRIR